MTKRQEILSYGQLVELLGKVKRNADVKECLSALRDEEIIFSPGLLKTKEDLIEYYSDRLKNVQLSQPNIDHSTLKKAIAKLKKSEAVSLGLSTVSTLTNTFCLFWDAANLTFEAGYKYPAVKSSFTKADKNYRRSVKRGYQVDALLYEKGELKQEWK